MIRKWNWQQTDWPNFSWKKNLLTKAEERFLLKAGTLVGTIKHLGSEDQNQLTVETISTEAVTTSEIEGEILNRDSVQSSIQKQLGLKTDRRRIEPAEQGIAEMMVDLYKSFDSSLSHKSLFKWHQMLMNGRRDIKKIGAYRTHKEPMEVVSGSIDSPRVHFQAPPSLKIQSQMSQFIKWFNQTAPNGTQPLPALTRAGMAHLYFVSIHPFEDGNGRIARGLSEKVLAQTLGRPTLTSLGTTILIKRKAYYTALDHANKKNEITPWLCWFAATTIEAQERTMGNVEFLIEKTKLLDRLKDQINSRQKKALIRMMKEGPSKFKGGMSAGKYISITGASAATATRDLQDLVEKNALVRKGERRHARYHVNINSKVIPSISIDKHGNVKEG